MSSEEIMKAIISYLPCHCIVDASRYHGKAGVEYDIKQVPAIFDSVNRFSDNDSRFYQKVGVTYNCGENGFRIINVFNEEHRVYTGFVHPENVKLVLKSLEQITDEDAIEVAKMLIYGVIIDNPTVEVSLTGKRVWTGGCGVAVIGDGNLYWTNNQFNLASVAVQHLKSFDYLRSKGYNIGYGSHSAQDLIDAGVVSIQNS